MVRVSVKHQYNGAGRTKQQIIDIKYEATTKGQQPAGNADRDRGAQSQQPRRSIKKARAREKAFNIFIFWRGEGTNIYT